MDLLLTVQLWVDATFPKCDFVSIAIDQIGKWIEAPYRGPLRGSIVINEFGQFRFITLRSTLVSFRVSNAVTKKFDRFLFKKKIKSMLFDDHELVPAYARRTL